MHAITLLCITASLALAGPAFADEATEAPDEVRFSKKTVIQFGELEVSGALTRPEHSLVLVRRGTRFSSLIRTRGDFRPELERSVDAL